MKSRSHALRLACVGAMLLVATTALVAGVSSPARAAGVVLTVKGPTGITRSYTLQQLKSKFPAYAGYAGYVKTQWVGMQAPSPVRGVRLLDVVKKVGYKSGSVSIKAADGYKLTYSSQKVHGKNVKMYVAKKPYRVIDLTRKDPLTAILAYQEKKAGARINDANPWKDYSSTYATNGSDGIGPLRFWWAYKKWISPGYVQIGWSSMRMVRSVTVGK